MRLSRLIFCLWFISVVPPLLAQDASNAPQRISAASNVLTNAEVLQMAAAGLSPDIIRAKIANSQCQFDTSSKALADLKTANLPDEVILAMVSAPTQTERAPVAPEEAIRHAAIEKEKRDAQVRCPGCLGVIISSFDPVSRAITDDWLSRNQLAYMKERAEKIKKEGRTPHFWYTKYRENADYVIVWSRATGSRAYTTYTPQTSTSTTSISGDVNATATTRTTTYQAQQNEWLFVNVVATVYGRDGSKKYETFHQGNYRWSKPDKDCLEDVFKYLSPKS